MRDDERRHLDSLRWGFIGSGRVVHEKSGEAFTREPDSSVLAVMRRDIEKAEESARHFGADFWFDSVDELLDSGVNAVYIATPPGLHFSQALACCAAGVPVYIEKPLARNYDEAKKIVECFETSNIPLFVGHYRRALPRFQRIKQLIVEGAIGRPSLIQTRLDRVFNPHEANEGWLYNPELSGGGKFYDIAAHSFDVIAFLLGDVDRISGFVANSGTDCPLEDSVACSFITETGVPGSSSYNCISDRKGDRVHLFGTEGALEFSVHGNCDVELLDYGNGERTIETIADPAFIEGPMIDQVISYLLGQGGSPCTGRDALPTYWAIDQVLDDFYGGRQGRFWEGGRYAS